MTPVLDATRLRLMARFAGLLYLVIIFAASFAELFVREPLIVAGDAAATAANILASEQIYRLGGGAQLVTLLCDVTLAMLFYELMKPAGKRLALASAFFRLGAILILGVATIAHFAPLTLLTNEAVTSGLGRPQAEALSFAALRMHSIGYDISLVLFGVHSLTLGALIMRATFLPSLIGLLVAAAGALYVANSFSSLVYPAFTAVLFPVLMPVAFLAEGALALWLTIMGVNADKWRAEAEATAQRG